MNYSDDKCPNDESVYEICERVKRRRAEKAADEIKANQVHETMLAVNALHGGRNMFDEIFGDKT